MNKHLHFKSTAFTLSALLAILFTVQSFAQDTVVYQAQQELKKLGYDPGPLDGLWGPRVKEAIKRFQEDKALNPTGDLDDKTRQKLGITLSPKQKSCSEIIAEWTTNDINKIAEHTRMSPETVKALGFNVPTVIAPPGCSLLVEGSKVRPYCNGVPLTKDSCDKPQ